VREDLDERIVDRALTLCVLQHRPRHGHARERHHDARARGNRDERRHVVDRSPRRGRRLSHLEDCYADPDAEVHRILSKKVFARMTVTKAAAAMDAMH